MIIKVAADRTVSLEEPDNFRAFKMVIAGKPAALADFRLALTSVAELIDADTAWVSAEALRRMPNVEGNEAWQQGFATMMEKARPYGWIDEARGAIKAHVEWVG
jgi:hypothetical protein